MTSSGRDTGRAAPGNLQSKDSKHSPPVTCRQRHRTEVGHVRTVAPQCRWKPLSHRSPAAGRAWPPPPRAAGGARRAKRGRALAAALGTDANPLPDAAARCPTPRLLGRKVADVRSQVTDGARWRASDPSTTGRHLAGRCPGLCASSSRSRGPRAEDRLRASNEAVEPDRGSSRAWTKLTGRGPVPAVGVALRDRAGQAGPARSGPARPVRCEPGHLGGWGRSSWPGGPPAAPAAGWSGAPP
jgi:hypothetical protein